VVPRDYTITGGGLMAVIYVGVFVVVRGLTGLV
jgi:hypothetical protein